MSDGTVTIARRAPVGMIALRCDLAAPPLADALARTLSAAVPGRRRIETGPGGAAAWMSPDELMLFVDPADVATVRATCGTALAGTHHLVVDVSDARALFRLAGAGARRVLAGGAPVDLAPQAFGPGDFRRTRLGQVAAAIWMTGPDVFDLMCFRSVEGFVADWLAAGAASVNRSQGSIDAADNIF